MNEKAKQTRTNNLTNESATKATNNAPLAKTSTNDYSDLLDVVYPFTGSKHSTRKRLAPDVRAAEFAPFAALTGFDETISATVSENLNQKEIEIITDPEFDEF